MLSQVHDGVLRASLTARVPLLSLKCATSLLVSSPRPFTRSQTRNLRPRSLIFPSRPRATPRDACSKARSFATLLETKLPKDIAVLGGGLTGLTTAYYLTRFLPDAKITVYEANDRLGGWIDTERISVKTQDGKDATISFERGARTVAPQSTANRWEDFVLYDLMDELNLLKDPETTPYAIPKFGSILSNRYVYYPDRLVKMPSPEAPNTSLLVKLNRVIKRVCLLLTEPVFKGTVSSLWAFFGKDAQAQTKTLPVPSRRAIADFEDMSAGEFLQKTLGTSEPINNLISALYHGIWGGDVWKLSASETFVQNLFFQLQYGGLKLQPVKDHDLASCVDLFERKPDAIVKYMQQYGTNCSYIGFHNGFSTLSDAVADALKRSPKVNIKTGTPVVAIRYDNTSQRTAVVQTRAETSSYDKVISSLYSGTLAKLTGDSLPSLKNSTAVTIQIVNLWYPDPHLLEDNPGFGYLIPQSVPAEQNPHAALGVIFDSDREAAAGTPEYVKAPGTKLTVMLGGHYWDFLAPESWPSTDEAAAMAIDTVERQLGIPASKPVYTSTKVCRECIPQHLAGHRTRMAQAHNELYNAFRGTLAVVGGSYTSPGILPTLKAARDMALKVSRQGYRSYDGSEDKLNMAHVGETGLGRFVGKTEKLLYMRPQYIPFRGKRGVSRTPRDIATQETASQNGRK